MQDGQGVGGLRQGLLELAGKLLDELDGGSGSGPVSVTVRRGQTELSLAGDGHGRGGAAAVQAQMLGLARQLVSSGPLRCILVRGEQWQSFTDAGPAAQPAPDLPRRLRVLLDALTAEPAPAKVIARHIGRPLSSRLRSDLARLSNIGLACHRPRGYCRP